MNKEKLIKDLRMELKLANDQLKESKKQLLDTRTKEIPKLVELIKENYLLIDKDEKSDKTKSSKEVDFFITVIEHFYGIKPDFLIVRNYGSVPTFLAVHYNSDKKKKAVCELLESMGLKNYAKTIKAHRMPDQWLKIDLIRFLTNEESKYPVHHGISQVWMEAGAYQNYAPLDFVMKNPLIYADDEIFSYFIRSIDNHSGGYFSMLHEDIKKFSGSQVLAISEKIISLGIPVYADKFISRCMEYMNPIIIEHFAFKMQCTNHYAKWHISVFPFKYQKYFFYNNPILFMENTNCLNCDWTDEQKIEIIKFTLK
jgi:hypothetical protein